MILKSRNISAHRSLETRSGDFDHFTGEHQVCVGKNGRKIIGIRQKDHTSAGLVEG